MSLKSIGSQRGGGEVLRSGLFKKLKTLRKKWFVLRAETPEASARLEYYDSEKKFNNGQAPKRSIPLKTCFNINKRHDTKHKHVIALYTKDDCFCVVLDTEDELESWLKALLSLQHGEDAVDGEAPRPTFEHVWQVAVLNRGLGTGRTGNYRLCLTDKTLCLVKKDGTKSVNLNLSNIRSCGSLKNYFFLEIGRSSLLGAGELWMESEDTTIAQNIHTTIFHAMSTNNKHDEMRLRSSSATEYSKPTNNSFRKQIVSGLPKVPPLPHPLSTISGGASSPSATTISHQRTQSLPLTDHHNPSFSATSNTTAVAAAAALATENPTQLQTSFRAPIIPNPTNINVAKGRSNQIAKCRERCDSMPSRSRTASEGTHQLPSCRTYLTPYRSYGRDISHSPPAGSPISPPSVGCSTDSAGSSYSLTDEGDMVCIECPETTGRYNSIPLTPDEAIAEEDCSESPSGVYDNYVPMQQQQQQSSDDGYVDMVTHSRHDIYSPNGSASSVVSGTPSTDIRFSDYPLDKVHSYVVSEEDDARPTRAYSFGSKPETSVGKKQLSESARARASSVGSKTKKGLGRILYHQHHPGLKSISVPLLNKSRSQSSHNFVNPMNDLMELDFSKVSNNNNPASNDTSSTTNNGYVEMKPGVEIIPKRKQVSPYVDMSGLSYKSGSSPSSRHEEEPNSFVDLNRQYSLPINNNYVDMDSRKTKAKPSTSPAWNADYFDVCGVHSTQSRSERGSSFSSQQSTSSSPRNADYFSINFSPQEKAKTPDGYVEMTVGKKHHRQSSLDGQNDDYLNMSMGSKKKSSKNQMVMSQPISIHSSTSSATKQHSGTLMGRKSSTGTPPKMHLPLSSWSTSSSYSSLPRTRPRKDSNSSSSSVTTPSSSSTIFPMSLNSPSSPLKATRLDVPSTKITPSSTYKQASKPTAVEDDYTVMNYDANRKNKQTENSDYVNYTPTTATREQSSSDYAVMESAKIEGAADRRDSLDTSPLIGHLSLIGIKESPVSFQSIKEETKKIADSSSEYMDVSPPPAARTSECVSPAAKISRPNDESSIVWHSSSTQATSKVGESSTEEKKPKLHYASLDLTTQDEEQNNKSPKVGKDGKEEASGVDESKFVYAEIDFNKSEGLKQTPNSNVKN